MLGVILVYLIVMKRSLFQLYVVISFSTTSFYAQNFLWAKAISGVNTGSNIGTSTGVAVKTDNKGFVYALGSFSNTVDFDPSIGWYPMTSYGNLDVYLAKYDSLGNFIWVKRFGGYNDDKAFSFTFDRSGNILVSGTFEVNADFDPSPSTYTLNSVSCFDLFTVKLDSNGNFIWAKQIGGYNSQSATFPNSTACDSLKNVYLAGMFTGVSDFDPGPSVSTSTAPASLTDAFICKLDSNGIFIWNRVITGNASDQAVSLEFDLKDNLLVGGQFGNNVTFNDGVSNYVFTSGGSSAFILKLNKNGNFVWQKQINYAIMKSFTVDRNKNILFAGDFLITVDFDPGPGSYPLTGALNTTSFISKLDSAGNFLWAKKLTASNAINNFSIVSDLRSSVLTAGTFSTVGYLNPATTTYTIGSINHYCPYLSVLDSSGNFAGAKFASSVYPFPFTNYVENKCVSVDKVGNAYLTGSYYFETNFDPGVTNYSLYITAPTNRSNAFIIKYSPTTTASQTVTAIETNTSSESDINVYPNPSSGFVNINSTKESLIFIYNSLGQPVHKTKIFQGQNKLDLSAIAPGIYFVEIRNRDTLKRVKLILN